MRRLQSVVFVVAALAVAPASARQAGQGSRVQAQPIFTEDPTRASTIAVGTKFDVYLQTALDSGTARIDQRFEAATADDVAKDGRVLIPAVTPVHGFISSVRAFLPARLPGSLTLSFDSLRIGGQSARLRASIDQVFSGRPGEAATRLGADASVRAAMSRMPGGDQALLPGVAIAAGGTIVSTQASDVHLPPGTVLRIRIDLPLEIPGGG